MTGTETLTGMGVFKYDLSRSGVAQKGYYKIFLNPGTYSITVYHPRYSISYYSLVVEDRAIKNFDLEMEPSGSVITCRNSSDCTQDTI